VKQLVAESGKNASAKAQNAAIAGCDFVLIAVPTAVAVSTVKALGDLSGKIVMDATKLFAFKDGKFIDPPQGECIAEQIQAAAPTAHVIKAFNTTNARVMANPAITGGPVTIPLAGASREAKARVAGLVTALGLEAVDIGGADLLRMAEHLGGLYVGYGIQNRSTSSKRLEFHLRIWG
jgi:predicted dinucleotide-binding enzyme